jgi:hypothetical protein
MRLMAKAAKIPSAAPKSFLAKRYSSVAEIKRDLLPVAAAEEAAVSGDRQGGYEKLITEFFGVGRPPAS